MKTSIGLTKIICSYLDLKGKALQLRTMCSAHCTSEKFVRSLLFMGGIALIGFALSGDAYAADSNGALTFNNTKLTNAVNAVMLYLEGSFGALVMAAAGIGAICAAAFGGYKAALSLMVVAVGAFILRSLMDTFFNCQGIMK